MIADHRPNSPRRSRVGTMSSRMAHPTHACLSSMTSRSSTPVRSTIVRCNCWRSGSIRWLTATEPGKSHCQAIAAEAVARSSTPLIITTGVPGRGGGTDAGTEGRSGVTRSPR
jgi:hypothetical protein